MIRMRIDDPLDDRQPDAKDGATRLRPLQRDAAAVTLDDGLRNRQADPEALGGTAGVVPPAIVAIEHEAQLLRVDAATLIADRNHGIAVLVPDPDLDHPARVS